MGIRLWDSDGEGDGIADRGMPLHRPSTSERAADPGLDQSERIGVGARWSLLDHPIISPNTGLHGQPANFARHGLGAPQKFRALRESLGEPVRVDALPYLPGKSPTVSEE